MHVHLLEWRHSRQGTVYSFKIIKNAIKKLTKIYKNARGEMLRIYSYLCSYVYNQYSPGLTKSQSVLKLLLGDQYNF